MPRHRLFADSVTNAVFGRDRRVASFNGFEAARRPRGGRVAGPALARYVARGRARWRARGLREGARRSHRRPLFSGGGGRKSEKKLKGERGKLEGVCNTELKAVVVVCRRDV